jgi:hypothetical protein
LNRSKKKYELQINTLKMLNNFGHLKNASQSYIEIPSLSRRNSYHQETTTNAARIQEKKEPLITIGGNVN